MTDLFRAVLNCLRIIMEMSGSLHITCSRRSRYSGGRHNMSLVSGRKSLERLLIFILISCLDDVILSDCSFCTLLWSTPFTTLLHRPPLVQGAF